MRLNYDGNVLQLLCDWTTSAVMQSELKVVSRLWLSVDFFVLKQLVQPRAKPF